MLTSHSCSEEGLEDAANVLLQLSRGDSGTRDTVLKLLLNGARHLGYTLCKQIGNNSIKAFYCFIISIPQYLSYQCAHARAHTKLEHASRAQLLFSSAGLFENKAGWLSCYH